MSLDSDSQLGLSLLSRANFRNKINKIKCKMMDIFMPLFQVP